MTGAGTMPGDAVVYASINAHLRHEAGWTMQAGAAAGIVMHHDARPDAGRWLAMREFCNHGHDAARLMSCDNRAVRLAESEREGRTGGAIELKIAAAHAGSLDFDDHIVRSKVPRREIRRAPAFVRQGKSTPRMVSPHSPACGLVPVFHLTGAASCSFPRKRMALCQHIILRALCTRPQPIGRPAVRSAATSASTLAVSRRMI